MHTELVCLYNSFSSCTPPLSDSALGRGLLAAYGHTTHCRVLASFISRDVVTRARVCGIT
jgi:hypothetical protein